MNNQIWAILLMSVLISGCSLMQKSKYLDQHNDEHIVNLDLTQKINSLIKQLSLRHRSVENDMYLSVSGKLYRPIGRNYSSATVKASFLNDKGEVLVETSDKIRLIRGTHTRRRPKGNFILKVQDNLEIAECKLEVEWS